MHFETHRLGPGPQPTNTTAAIENHDPFLTALASSFIVRLPMQTKRLSMQPMFRASEAGRDCASYHPALGNQEKVT
jgi:hypothetical protein